MSYHDIRFDEGQGLNRDKLADRIVGGEVFVARQALQATNLFDMWTAASLRGIAASVGQEAADRAARDGFHRIHEWVSPVDIPRMTDAVYDEIALLADEFLSQFMKKAFPGVGNYYYERVPNVRFHIPFDLASAHKKEFNKFAKTHGQGKIAAHGPHRDSWLDCASNGINLWFAVGRVRHGNSLTIYSEDMKDSYQYKRSGDIQDGEKLHRATTFDLEPGDVIMFHTDQLHGSELNRIDETRFAISCRLSIEKPVFPKLHFHPYLHSGLTGTPLKPLAEIPAMAQTSYAKSFVIRARDKLLPSMRAPESKPGKVPVIGIKEDGVFKIPLTDLPVGEIRALSNALCVARTAKDQVVALSRRCPHASGDLVNGWLDADNIVCPWHNLPFSTATGASPCKSLAKLRKVACEITDGTIVVDPAIILNDDAEETLPTIANATS